MTKLISIPFYDQNIIAIEKDKQIFVSLKRICFNLSIDYHAQKQRIDRDPVLSKGVCIIQTPTNGGIQDVVCLSSKMLNGFLFGITVNKIKDKKIQAIIIKYQERCYEVLDNFFNKKETQLRLPTTYIEALEALLVAEKEKIALQQKSDAQEHILEQQAPKIEKYNLLHDAYGLYTLQDGMKALHLFPNKAIERLRTKGYLDANNMPYQRHINAGYFVEKTHPIEIIDKITKKKFIKSKTQAYLHPKGLAYFRDRIDELFSDLKIKEPKSNQII